MIRCTEVYSNLGGILIKMKSNIFINLENVKFISLSADKFNSDVIYNIRFTDNSSMLVVSDQLDNMLGNA